MRSPGRLRIVLVDDHPVVRAGYRRFLERESDYEVVAEAASGEEVYALLRTLAPDVVVLDLSLPGQGGLATLRRLKVRWPLLPVLVFSMHADPVFAIQALRAGANGYLTKSSAPELMMSAIRAVVSGEQMLSPDIAARIEQRVRGSALPPMLGLSVREFDVFRLIASGKTHEEIGALLCLSVKTIANYHSLIRQKLGIDTDIEQATIPPVRFLPAS